MLVHYAKRLSVNQLSCSMLTVFILYPRPPNTAHIEGMAFFDLRLCFEATCMPVISRRYG